MAKCISRNRAIFIAFRDAISGLLRNSTIYWDDPRIIVLYCIALYCICIGILLHCIALHCIVLYCIILYCIVFCSILFYFIAL